jgi:hypothetical protein
MPNLEGADMKFENESFPWLDDLRERGRWSTGDQLAPPRRARSVRVRDGRPIVTDGPVLETKEAVGGFDIIDCGSLEEAVERRSITGRLVVRYLEALP